MSSPAIPRGVAVDSIAKLLEYQEFDGRPIAEG
jgi:hypothetical protein